jgi:hypothetical protein
VLGKINCRKLVKMSTPENHFKEEKTFTKSTESLVLVTSGIIGLEL